jgi:hypothetical protein
VGGEAAGGDSAVLAAGPPIRAPPVLLVPLLLLLLLPAPLCELRFWRKRRSASRPASIAAPRSITVFSRTKDWSNRVFYKAAYRPGHIPEARA